MFVPREAGKSPDVILAALGGSPTLLVGEREDFARRGGCINFINENGKLRFEVNLSAVARARLILSKKLVEISRVVQDASPAKKD